MNKEIVYLLGFLWADGCYYKNKNCNHIQISCELLESDSYIIDSIIPKTNTNWHIYTRTRKNSNKVQKVFTLRTKTNKEFIELLTNYGFNNKLQSFDACLNYIPSNLHYLWFRGFFDGDGSIYVARTVKLAFYGNYNQNWDSLTKLYNSLDISYCQQQISRKNGKHLSSQVVSSKKTDLTKFFNYIYPQNSYDGIGLVRKYEKFLNPCLYQINGTGSKQMISQSSTTKIYT